MLYNSFLVKNAKEYVVDTLVELNNLVLEKEEFSALQN